MGRPEEFRSRTHPARGRPAPARSARRVRETGHQERPPQQHDEGRGVQDRACHRLPRLPTRRDQGDHDRRGHDQDRIRSAERQAQHRQVDVHQRCQRRVRRVRDQEQDRPLPALRHRAELRRRMPEVRLQKTVTTDRPKRTPLSGARFFIYNITTKIG